MEKWVKMFEEFGKRIDDVSKACEEINSEKVQPFSSSSLFKSNIWGDPETARIMRTYSAEQWAALSEQEKKDYQAEEPKRLAIIREKQAEETLNQRVQKALDIFKQ